MTSDRPRARGRAAEVTWTDDDGVEHRAGASSCSRPARRPCSTGCSATAPAGPAPEGSQLKVNMVLSRLPRLRSGIDPALAFAGTFHVNETATQLEAAYAEAAAGRIPTLPPVETYCHSLTDDSILGPELRASGAHTLTAFGLHMPARLFVDDPEGARGGGARRDARSIDSVLAEPIEDCLARDAAARRASRCAARSTWRRTWRCPAATSSTATWRGRGRERDDEVGAWGVETADPRVLLAGPGARAAGASAPSPAAPRRWSWSRAPDREVLRGNRCCRRSAAPTTPGGPL